jgi:hypothetical protein
MIRFLVMLAGLLPLPGAEALANTLECGGNSFSYAEVLTNRGRKPPQGPIQVVPDSLCADLIEHRRSAIRSLDVTIDPRASGGAEPDPREIEK